MEEYKPKPTENQTDLLLKRVQMLENTVASWVMTINATIKDQDGLHVRLQALENLLAENPDAVR